MIPDHDLIIDQFAPEVDSEKRLTTWYAQGHSDGLGDRLLMFDNTNAPSWEILRFKPALAHDARFEAALRQRVDQLSSFHHASFPLVRPIKKLGTEDGLAVVSTYVSGAALSEALKKPRSPQFSIRLLRQLVPALVALQQHAPGAAHGVLNVDRIVLSSEGTLMIREHMVGSALASLELSAARLWLEFGILTLPTTSAVPPFDERNDIAQLAIAAVSLMAGRRIGPDEFPDKIHEVLDEVAVRNLWHGPVIVQSLRDWLERALQIGDQPFESAEEAHDALADVRDEPEPAPDSVQQPLRIAPPDPATALKEAAPPPMWSARGLPAPAPEGSIATTDRRVAALGRVLPALRRVPLIRWAVIAVAVLALGEAVYIGRLLYARSGAPAAAGAKAVDATVAVDRAQSRVDIGTISQPAAAPPPIVVATQPALPLPDIRPLPAPGAAPVRSGGFRVSAPVEIHVLDGERVIGSSVEGPIIAPAGRHEYEFVNSVIGYRARQVVDVKAGQITVLAVAVPNGNLNINATPWATVWIDGNPYGETPLGNLSLVPGEHEILFRHPELGERRQKTIVRPDVETRVSVNLQR